MKLFHNLMLLLAATSVVACADYVPVETFAEADDPVALTADDEAAWAAVEKNINAAWGDADCRYSRSLVPQEEGVETLKITLWRGEKGQAQALVWTPEGLDGVECSFADFKSADATLPASIAQTFFVRYTLADQFLPTREKAVLMADMLDNLPRFDIAAKTTRPVWVTLDIPEDAAAGTYKSTLTVRHAGWGKAKLPIEVEVVKHVLPAAKEWSYHLDLWQHPTAIARAEGLELWSDEHLEAGKRQMALLADAGQKVITTTLNKDPWNHQCYDAYEDMIRWTLRKDGSWSYDYTNFDRWVEMMLTTGINKMINCYSMVPWNCELHYMDEAKGEMVTVKAEPGKPIFNDMWSPFLKDFKQHLQQKGWLSITNIAMDERSPEQMDAAAKLLQECAPELGFALADNHNSYKRYTMMNDVCAALRRQLVDHEDIVMRRAKNQNTTFYVCCGPYFPNTFTWSQPYEAEMLGWLNVTYDYDGMLRWAYNSWPSDPQMDSRFGSWPAGDTYLTYPQCHSSLRFERLIDGIESAEKVRR
ncbi:MAG: DUF4091 domain-containing protein [Alistipes sp.]|nr:DUF4091 domain-containing protein [Alistipes sp.]